MKICLDCIPCFVRQTLDSVRLMTADKQIHEQILPHPIHRRRQPYREGDERRL